MFIYIFFKKNAFIEEKKPAAIMSLSHKMLMHSFHYKVQ